ncbi:transposase [Corynebacterium sp. LaCa116]|uniref:transposase n=1 Tax=Corynebacterium sp. LaCa116 TaxID=3391423 RepID=UPI003989C414
MCSDALIGARIKTIFDDEHGLYGAKRITATLNDDMDFPPINHKKVASIMKSMGLKGRFDAWPGFLACFHTCSSTPRTRTPSRWWGSP